jgi:peptide chain release factor 3
MRICSGKFERNKFYHHVRLSKKLRFAAPLLFQASDRNTVDEAWPGDVVGLYDTGNFKIGDSLTEGEKLYFKGIPAFSPELFRRVENLDPFKAKQFDKGLRQLTDEGVAQLFVQQPGNRKVIGTVGELQFDVIQFRMLHEYGAKVRYQALPYLKACWIHAADSEQIDSFFQYRREHHAFDKDGNSVYLADSEWMLQRLQSENPGLEFRFSAEVMVQDGEDNPNGDEG